MANNYAFQTVGVSGASGTEITGINDGAGTPAELSGSYWLAIPNFPYQQGFTMEGGTPFTFGPGGQPYGLQNTAGNLNNSGQIAGFSGHFIQTERGYLYTPGSGGAYTPMLANTNQANTVTTASDVNDTQQVVGKFAANGGWSGFIWQNGSMQAINYPGQPLTSATGINDKGQVVGFYSDGSVNGFEVDHGFVWKNGNFTKVDLPGAVSTDPEDIDNKGDILGSYYDGAHWHGFIKSGGQMTFLNAPGATDTWIEAGNDFGQVAGYYETAGGVMHGFVATPGNGQNLASLAEMAPLPNVVKQLTGQSVGHAYFDPSLPVTVMAVAHS